MEKRASKWLETHSQRHRDIWIFAVSRFILNFWEKTWFIPVVKQACRLWKRDKIRHSD